MPNPNKREQLKAKRRSLAKRAEKRRYDFNLLEKYKAKKRDYAKQNFILSKQTISDKAKDFKAKYLDQNSQFQARLEYMKSTLKEEEYKNTPEAKMESIILTLLNDGVDNLSKYSDMTELYEKETVEDKEYLRFSSNSFREKERSYLMNADKAFKEIDASIKQMMDGDFGMSEAFADFYSDIKELQDNVQGIVSGGLNTDCQYTYSITLTEDVKEIDPNTGKEITVKKIREPIPKEHFLVTTDDNGKETSREKVEVEYVSMKDVPLFAHEPCVEDIRQGAVGDCYFIAAMQAVAENNPEFIRNCMKDNGDGTVSVRLFDKNRNPILVTVNKTVPCIKHEGEYKTVYARGGLWVSMLEKAYVQSGISYDKDKFFEKNESTVKNLETGEIVDFNAYEKIAGGRTNDATLIILGDSVIEYKPGTHNQVRIPKGNSIPNKSAWELPYNVDEKGLFLQISGYVKAGQTVTCGINKVEGIPDDQHYEVTKGLPVGHAYSILDVKEQKIMRGGKPHTGFFVKIKNPHSSGGRIYDDKGNPEYTENPEVPGESWVELRDFENTFSSCYAFKYEKSFVETIQDRIVSDNKTLYGDAIQKACDEIIKSDPWYVLNSSESFKNLKTSAIELRKEYQKKNPDPEEMKKKLEMFFKKSQEYKNDRDTRTEGKSKDLRERSMQRYQLVSAVELFSDIYEVNKKGGMEYVDFDSLKEQALDIALDDKYAKASRAKLATAKGLTADKNKQYTREAVNNGIMQVEQKGLDRIKDGLKNNKLSEMKKGLAEVFVARALNEKKDNLRPEDIDRQLSDDSIERMADKLDKKFDAAFKDIKRDIFLEIIKSDNIGEKLFNTVESSIKKNEKAGPDNQAQMQGKDIENEKSIL